MPPQPILLYRRRWTLIFQVPFTLMMILCLAYAVYFAVAVEGPLFRAVFSFAAFGAFCIAWTLGRAAWEAYQSRDPAVVLDGTGITDLRSDAQRFVPWEAMERVHLDNYENMILIRLRTTRSDSALGILFTTLQRWQQGGDVAFSLRGLAYDTRQIQTALKAFHTAATPRVPSAGPEAPLAARRGR